MPQRKVLLLENVAAQAAGVRERLAKAGYQVAVSRYEADGLKRIAEWDPDVVLLSAAHPAGDLVEFCRRVRELAPAVQVVVTSSLDRERLLQGHPGLEEFIDGVILRPYSFEEVADLLRRVVDEPRTRAAAARVVVTVERDAELVARLRRALEPRGVEVAALPVEGIAAFCGTRRPALLVLDWPLPPEFVAGPLGLVRAGGGVPVPVLLLSDVPQETVFGRAPALVQVVDMFFRKPVAWELFFRVVARHLELPELARIQAETANQAAAPPPPPNAPGAGAREIEALRAEFQRQLEAKFLEVEELRHRLDAAAGPPAESSGGIEWLRSENEHLREAAQAAEKRASLALAMEQLKRSELEVKLDNLLRMKDDFERRAQDEIDAKTEGYERLRQELEALREEGSRDGAELGALRAEHERTLVEKEQLEERLHRGGEGGAGEAPDGRLAALEAEARQLRAQAAAAEAALARETEGRAAETGVLQERALAAENRCAEAERRAAEAESRAGELENRCAEAERRAAEAESRAGELENRCAEAENRAEELRAGRGALEAEARESAAALSSARQQCVAEAAGREELGGELEREKDARTEAEQVLAREREERAAQVRLLREREEAAEAQLVLLRAQAGERALREEAERKASSERFDQAVHDLEERGRRVAALEEELARAEESLAAASAENRRLLAAAELQQAEIRALEQRLASRPSPSAGDGAVQSDLQRIRDLLEEVITRARTDAVDHARREAELTVRLESALEERRSLQERFDRAVAEAGERERRSVSLLQSAIERRGAAAPAVAERDNLPAIVPEGVPRRISPRTATIAGLALLVAVAVAGVALVGARRAGTSRAGAPAVRDPGPTPGAGLPTPSEVWDRWTRSDGSGGVFVQATLRSEAQLRSEVEAEQRARGLSADQARAELLRRLSDYRFEDFFYVGIYLKNLSPGYPAYLDDLVGRLRLRDATGREAAAFVPPGHEKQLRIYSYGAGAAEERLYEAKLSVGFARADLARSPAYLQLVVSSVGAASRRALTWELE